MKVTRVLIINSNTKQKFIVDFSNDQLDELAKEIIIPSERGMVDYTASDTIESLLTPNKYYISGDENSNYYQIDILEELMKGLDKTKELQSMNDLYNDNELLYNVVGYLVEEDNGNKGLFLYQLKKTNLVKDKGFWIFKKKAGSGNGAEVKVEQITDGFNLPVDDCLASLYKRKDEAEGKVYKARIYQAYLFDKVFGTSETQHKYVDRTLKKFGNSESQITIARNEIKVSFTDIKKLETKIYSDSHLTKTFANYHDTSRRKIKQISSDKLKEVLDTLKDFVKNNADAGFEQKNIPVFDDDAKELKVSEDSIPTFAALLDNKVIQRLLNNQIEIPYYKRMSRLKNN
ncbi:hypothetical protein [Lactobacillus amylovorus]|uniref:hypothetical protein n=1 Tax=Lactobacillus amylovorus TaxID=1604 RepID=UPI003F8C7ADF